MTLTGGDQMNTDEIERRTPLQQHNDSYSSARSSGDKDTTIALTKPVYTNGRFYNPWDTWVERSIWQQIKLFRESDSGPSPTIPVDIDTHLPVVTPNYSKLLQPPSTGMQACWLGHASVLVQFDGLNVLCDPVFSERCSPVSFMGPKRYRPMPCGVDDLPQIDAVLISHTHYDHLDTNTIKKLDARFGMNVQWFVPLKASSILTCVGCKNVTELSWWDEKDMTINGNRFKFVFTPTQHFTNRGIMDMNTCLWGSWVVIGPNYRYFFGGDTAYCSGFKEIGNKYGPMDFAAIPIGAYHPAAVMSNIHCNPHEAVEIHCDVKAKQSVGIHWGTFVLTREPILQPPKRLAEALTAKGLNHDDFLVTKHGEVFDVRC
eukprot:Lankesteria_metandrocarpae@DN2722_c0_g1_i1.p1